MTTKTQSARSAHLALKKLATPETAKALSRFFKCAEGEYGEGDLFLGVKVPQVRTTAKQFASLPLQEVVTLLCSPYHEARLLGLLILCLQFKKGQAAEKRKIHSLFMKNLRYVNNWDLVDTSAPFLVGEYLYAKDRRTLFKLAKSKNLWKRRIAILATFHFIRQNDFSTTLEISKLLLKDDHDLIHKAVGWMLREVGNREREVEEEFLRAHYKEMPRTMLRYAIEKFPEPLRTKYLKGAV